MLWQRVFRDQFKRCPYGEKWSSFVAKQRLEISKNYFLLGHYYSLLKIALLLVFLLFHLITWKMQMYCILYTRGESHLGFTLIPTLPSYAVYDCIIVENVICIIFLKNLENLILYTFQFIFSFDLYTNVVFFTLWNQQPFSESLSHSFKKTIGTLWI